MRQRLLLAAVVALLAAAVTGGCSGKGQGSPPSPSASATAVGSPTTPASASVTATASATATRAPASPPGTTRRLGSPTGGAFTQRAPDFAPLPGATADFGVLGGSVYRIEIPNNWNGDLILFAHGVRLSTNELSVSNPDAALRQLWISQGFAWAASSFSENGYTPGIGADDTIALLDFFSGKYRAPGRTYLYGVSMGGNVTALLLENYPNRFAGALAVCGALGGEEQIDYLVAWAMAAEFISGVTLPTGSGQAAMYSALLQQLPRALGSPDAPTPQGLQFLSVARALSGGPRPFFFEGFRDSYQLNFGLLLLDPDRRTLPGRAATNANTVYSIDESLGITSQALNAGVRRLPADPAARDGAANPDAVPTTGNISVPLLTLHNTGDVFVPITNEITYARKAAALGKGNLLVQRAIRAAGHCQFSDQELTTAWNDLRAWVENGNKPKGDDLSGDLSDIGRQFTNPLRPGDPGTK